MQTHNDQRRIIEFIFTIDVDTLIDKLLAFPEVAMTTCEKKFSKLIALVEGIVLSQYAILDQSMLLVELALQAIFRHYHLEQSVRWRREDAASKNDQFDLQANKKDERELPQQDL